MEIAIREIIRTQNTINCKMNDIELEPFKIKKTHFYSISFLQNDIQKFYDLFKIFLKDYFEYFEQPKNLDYSSLQSFESEYTEKKIDDFRIEACTPVIPALHDAFFNIKLVDNYRITNDDNLIDELFERVGDKNQLENITQESEESVEEVEIRKPKGKKPPNHKSSSKKLSTILE